MFRQFIPSEEKFGWIPSVTFKDDDPHGAFGSVAIAKNTKVRNYEILDKHVDISTGETIVVKKYKPMVEAFEYEEEEGFFIQSSDEFGHEYVDKAIERWRNFEYVNVNPEQVKSLRKGTKGKDVWDTLVEQRQEIIDAIKLHNPGIDVSEKKFIEIKKLARRIKIGKQYFKNIKERCRAMTKLLLLNEVQLQQKLANTSPQAAPVIFGYDDNKFIISMEALDEEIYQKNRKIPDYTQYQMVALVKLFDQAKIKRKDGNKRNYMSKGLRTYAIDVGMDENLKDGDTNKVKDVFFSRDRVGFYGSDKVDILTAALNDDEFEAIAERGMDIMRFLDELDANPQDFFFFQLENVDTEEDIMQKFQSSEGLWSALTDIGVGLGLIPHEPAIFWGNETWWCAYVQGKFILSENVGKIDQARIKSDTLQQKLVSNISSDESNVILAYLYNKYKHKKSAQVAIQ
tara:strand:- start:666 stop:2033 length:1368 start_codon:yes stop_codon:yes gene_type:complete